VTIALFAVLTVAFIVIWFLYSMLSALGDAAGGFLSGMTRGAIKHESSKASFAPHLVFAAFTLASLVGTLWSIFK
jgi:hypothetical protein